MKYKILSVLFFLFLLVHVYLSYLNPEDIKLYVGDGQYYQTSVANFVTISFVLGLLISVIVGLISDMGRGIRTWRAGKQARRREELVELLERARSYELRGEREKAIDYAEKLIKSSPDLEDAYLLVADLYLASKEHDKARETLKLAQANLGKREAILFKMVRVDLATKDVAQVQKNLKDILSINESSLKAMGILRDLHVCNKEWDQALELEKRLRKHIKTDEEHRRLLGIRYEKIKDLYEKQGQQGQYGQKDQESVAKELRDILSEDKRFIPAYVLLAEVYKNMGKLNDAARVFGRGYSKTGHIIFLLKMEDLYIARGEPGVILKIYRKILDVSPRNRFMMFLYAKLCLRLEMIDEAIDTLNTLFASEGDFKGLHRAMAEAYIHRGELESAIEEFRKAFPIENVYVPFVCGKCQSMKEEWQDFCESCFSWNTISVKQEGLFQEEGTELRVLYEQDWGEQW
jgi:tetratricopeptide (TPR) repeat protein